MAHAARLRDPFLALGVKELVGHLQELERTEKRRAPLQSLRQTVHPEPQ